MMNKKKIIKISLVVFLIGFGTIFGINTYMNSKVEVNVETKDEMYSVVGKEKIFFNGKVFPTNSEKFLLTSDMGELNEMKVKDGDIVTKDTILFTTKNQSKIDEIENLKTQLKQKEKERANIKKQALDSNSDVLVAVTPIDNEMETIKKQISTLEKTATTTVKAPFDGKIYMADSSIQEEYILILESQSFFVKAQINERDSYKIKKEQDVEINILANESTVTGKITEVSDMPYSGESLGNNNDMNMTSYGVDISINEQENLKNGLHVRVLARYGDNEIKIPEDSIYVENDKNYVFLVKDEGLTEKIEVTVSRSENGFSYITSGINEDDKIMKYGYEHALDRGLVK